MSHHVCHPQDPSTPTHLTKEKLQRDVLFSTSTIKSNDQDQNPACNIIDSALISSLRASQSSTVVVVQYLPQIFQIYIISATLLKTYIMARNHHGFDLEEGRSSDAGRPPTFSSTTVERDIEEGCISSSSSSYSLSTSTDEVSLEHSRSLDPPGEAPEHRLSVDTDMHVPHDIPQEMSD